MDSLVASAARSLAAGDPLGALKRVALRDDPPALALRGIAMAQLGDYERARKLLRRAARSFGARERLARARCQVAEAEVALAARDLSWPVRTLDAAARALDALSDRANALHARLIVARRYLLVGELEAAERTLAAVDVAAATVPPPPFAARAELTRAELTLRRVRVADAEAALDRAHAAAVAAGIPALVAEIGRARRRPDGTVGAPHQSRRGRRLGPPRRPAGAASQVPGLRGGLCRAGDRYRNLSLHRLCPSSDARDRVHGSTCVPRDETIARARPNVHCPAPRRAKSEEMK